MKANEMPKKIYLFDYNDAMVTPIEGDTVYVREDVFIEKAVNYLDYKLSDIVKVRQAGTIIEAAMIKTEFIEDFKKAMKL